MFDIYICYPFPVYPKYQYISHAPSTCKTGIEWNYCLHAYFLQTVQGNLPSIVTFQTFSLLIIIFAFLTLTLDPSDCSNAPFQASSFPFRLWSVSQINVKSSGKSSFSGHPGLISLNTASITMIHNKGSNTEPWCNLNWALMQYFRHLYFVYNGFVFFLQNVFCHPYWQYVNSLCFI